MGRRHHVVKEEGCRHDGRERAYSDASGGGAVRKEETQGK
jgi:hypothetical protein